MYQPLVLPPDVPGRIRSFVAENVDPYFADVHGMLRLPNSEITAGCNLTIGQVLLSAIGGLSRIFLPTIEGAGKAFTEVLRFYPPEAGSVASPDFESLLWTTYRNSLAHSFGLNLKWLPERRKPGRHEVQPMPADVKIARLTSDGLSEDQVEQLEDQQVRPPWLSCATLRLEGRRYLLCAEALYWGTRRLTQILADSPALAAEADRLLLAVYPLTALSVLALPGAAYRWPTDIGSTLGPLTSTRLDLQEPQIPE